MPPSYMRVRAVVWAYGRGQTDRDTDRQSDTLSRVTTIHFASSTTHAKCNKNSSGDEIANVNFFYNIAHVEASAYAH